MKTKLLLILSAFAMTGVVAQTESKNEFTVVLLNDTTIKGNQDDDTLHMRIGDMKIDIYPDSTSRLITTDKKCKSLPIEDFPWQGFEGIRFGFLTFMDADQNSYEPEWLQNQGKRNSSGYIGMSVVNTSFELIKDRKSNLDKGYTSYLFEKGLDKILKKIAEEAGEVIIASKNNNEETIYEISDLIYHLFVLMVNNGIELDDIYKELSSRRK